MSELLFVKLEINEKKMKFYIFNGEANKILSMKFSVFYWPWLSSHLNYLTTPAESFKKYFSLNFFDRFLTWLIQLVMRVKLQVLLFVGFFNLYLSAHDVDFSYDGKMIEIMKNS